MQLGFGHEMPWVAHLARGHQELSAGWVKDFRFLASAAINSLPEGNCTASSGSLKRLSFIDAAAVNLPVCGS
jgi:hypothetical protein